MRAWAGLAACVRCSYLMKSCGAQVLFSSGKVWRNFTLCTGLYFGGSVWLVISSSQDLIVPGGKPPLCLLAASFNLIPLVLLQNSSAGLLNACWAGGLAVGAVFTLPDVGCSWCVLFSPLVCWTGLCRALLSAVFSILSGVRLPPVPVPVPFGSAFGSATQKVVLLSKDCFGLLWVRSGAQLGAGFGHAVASL